MVMHGKRTEEALDAARCGQAYEVEEAIHLGADVSASDPHGMTALHFAAARCDILASPRHCIACFLLMALNTDGKHAQSGLKQLKSLAVRRGSLTIVNVLLRYGAPLDAQDFAGMTALHSAVIHDRSNVVSRLVCVRFCRVCSKQKK
jgi:ankyrin repeat protein